MSDGQIDSQITDGGRETPRVYRCVPSHVNSEGFLIQPGSLLLSLLR